MTDYFADSSAIVKCYVAEAGSGWLRALSTDPDNSVMMAEVTLAEVAAAFASARRNGRISAEECRSNLDLLVGDAANTYELIPVQRAVVDRAVELTQRYRLRGYDAIQLASALEVEQVLRRNSGAPPIFLSADADLLRAAQQEGLGSENPNDH